ncbi:transcription termination factor 2-like isoform X2 [Sipha flava]|uniref:Transcription termination factor 2 n=1 Tax=Sipha flava TaxID=143950 RepID=A0A8B8FNZ4_9HEMI|nr:transcription termination factor 2-like isoform X2 [Sipha flava]
MKSSRSSSSRNTRRNARRFMSESSEDSENDYSSNSIQMDSARAEKLFSHRRLPNSMSNNKKNQPNHIEANRTLFRVSDSDTSDSISQSNSAIDKKLCKNQQKTKKHFDETKNSNYDILNGFSVSKNNSALVDSDLSVKDYSQEKYVDRLIQSASENSTDNDSILKLPKMLRNQRRIIDSSEESDVATDIKKNQTNHIEDHRSLFSVSGSDTSYLSSQSLKNKKISKNKKKAVKEFDETSDSKITNGVNTSDKSINEFMHKPSNHDFVKYRNISLRSDDEESKSSNYNIFNDSCESKQNSASVDSDLSVGNDLQEKYVDQSIHSASENSTDNDSILKLPKMLKNRPHQVLESSDESDVVTGQNTVINETKIIQESESDEDIINSSKELYPTPMKANHEKSQLDIKLKELSLIESSDDDSDASNHYKSNIASSNQNLSFSDEIKMSNTSHFLHEPLSHSSILVNPSNVQKYKQSMELITLDTESPIVQNPKEFSLKQKNPIIIDLTKNNSDSDSSIILLDDNSSKNPKKLTNNEANSLRMEKNRLEDIIRQFMKNIDNMKNTMKVTNLHLLPDGGLRLKQAIKKEETALKDTKIQLNNVLTKLKEFSDEFSNHLNEPKLPPLLGLNPLKSFNCNDALIKKAAANIDIKAMGDKALSVYRTQQTMTLDVLQSLHNSLKTCPTTDMLADDPLGLKVELMDHQKYALSWLMWRESQKPHGGILADDMGLGKTLTMISLILKAEAEKKQEHFETDDSDRGVIKGGTLIICPSSLINQWINEIKSKLSPRLLDFVQHYGPNRESSPRRLSRKDVVITTYHVVMWDHKSHQHTSPLFQIKWKRIILDEAHTIRNPKSQTSIAICALSSVNYWALSGTPIHNKEADFYALLKFIKCHPFDDWAVWKRWVGNNDDAGKNRLSLLVKTLMLRRTKVELSEATTFKLPSKTVHTVKVELFKEEKEAYEKVLLFSSKLFATYLYEKAEKQNAIGNAYPVYNKTKYLHQKNIDDNIFKDLPELDKLFSQLKNNNNIQAHHILVLILRLRQLCCHPFLMKNMLESENLKVDGIQDTGDLELIDNMSRMSIGIPSVETKPLSNSNPIFDDSWISSKIKAVCDMVKEKVLHTNDKAIIVSQWPSMLHLIDNQLSQYQVKTELFSGAVPVLQRNKIVDEFNNLKHGPRILLLSLTAGGVGLNLVAANHMFLVDIHWNPQLEAQACDRIYRVGQTKPVNVYKFICSNTIESSIQSIQSHKLQIANNLFGGCSNVEGSKITLDDLKHIFNINPKFKQ